MDALSATLRVVHLTDANFRSGRFEAPWCYQSPRTGISTSIRASTAEGNIAFRMITQGDCYLEVAGQTPMHLKAGDAVILPRGDAHRLTSAPGLTPAAGTNLDLELSNYHHNLPQSIDLATHVVCGNLMCEASLSRMLFAGLPQLIKVSVRSCEAGVWLEEAIRYSLGEARSPRPGAASVLTKLAEVLLIEVLRIYLNEQSNGRTGWLAGLGDRIVGAALKALHSDPARPWTLEDLAHEAGASRSVLAERFQQLVGSSPIQYLIHWRMLLAANLLCDSNVPLARIAEEVGYQTDTSFSRAFRRSYGTPPAAWRRTKSKTRIIALSS